MVIWWWLTSEWAPKTHSLFECWMKKQLKSTHFTVHTFDSEKMERSLCSFHSHTMRFACPLHWINYHIDFNDVRESIQFKFVISGCASCKHFSPLMRSKLRKRFKNSELFRNCRRQFPSVQIDLANQRTKLTTFVRGCCCRSARLFFSRFSHCSCTHTFGMGLYCHFAEPLSSTTSSSPSRYRGIFKSDRACFVLNDLHAPRPRLMLLSHFLVKCVPIDRHRCLWWAQKQWFKFIDVSFCFISFHFVGAWLFIQFFCSASKFVRIELNLFVKQK